MSCNFLSEFFNCGAIISTPEKKLLLGWGRREWSDRQRDLNRPAFYSSDFYLDEPQPWFQHENHVVMGVDSLEEELHSAKTSNTKEITWSTADFEVFHRAFTDLQHRFASKELEKAVPFIFGETTSTINKERLFYCLQNLLHYIKKNDAHVYGFWDENGGILGATPEILFHQSRKKMNEERLIHTVACAGTCPEGEDSKLLLESVKDNYEHDLVVKGITGSLAPHGKVIVGKKRALHLESLTHLYTDITFFPSKPIDFNTLVRILHPTPALGAYPPEAGLSWSREFYKDVDRKRFGAPFGYVLGREKEGFCLVGIRNAQWNREHIQIGAGCGVVKSSDENREWEEILLKLSSTKEMLGL